MTGLFSTCFEDVPRRKSHQFKCPIKWDQLFVIPMTGSGTTQVPEMGAEVPGTSMRGTPNQEQDSSGLRLRPQLIHSLRRSQVCHFSKSGAKACWIPAGEAPPIVEAFMLVLFNPVQSYALAIWVVS